MEDVKVVKLCTNQHFFILAHSDTLALDNMDIFQSAQHLMVDSKFDLGVELGAFLDSEWFVLERLESVGSGKVEGEVGAAGGLNGQRFDDAFARVVGIANGVAGVQAKRGFPSVEGLVVLVWCGRSN